MLIGRRQEQELILHHLQQPPSATEVKRIIAVNGLFGVGKSTLLRAMIADIQQKALADALLISNEDAHVQYLPEFVYQLMNSFRACKADTPRFRSDETDSRWMRFSEIAGELKTRDAEAWQTIEERSTLRSASERMEYQPQSNSENSFDASIRSRFKSADDQRLTLDTGNVVSEALIVDLMNTFYPLNDNIQTLGDYIKKGAARKIVILIDTYEKISATLNQWLLENFLPYCYTKRFGDFRSYNSPFLTPDLAVSQFFDFRFIIAGREPLSTTDAERRWDRWRSTLAEMHLEEFSEEEIQQFLKQEGIVSSVSSEELRSATTGLPYLVSLWADVFKARRAGADSSYLAALAQERVFWYKTEQQKEWIRAAAFCEWFDADALRCFPPANQSYKEAFNYLRHSAELTRPSDVKQGKICLHPIISRSIREATEQESQDTAKEYRAIASTFYQANALLNQYNTAMREAIRNLAYFSAFDLDFALPRFLPDDVSTVKSFLNESFIHKNKHSYTLEESFRTTLIQYNKVADRSRYEEKFTAVREIWHNRKRLLEAERSKAEQQQEELRRTIHSLENELLHKRKLAEDAQTRSLNADNEMVSLRRRGQYRMANRDVAASRIAAITGIILAALAYGVPELLSNTEGIHQDTVHSLQRVLYIFAGVFGLLFLIFMFRALFIRSQRKEQESMRSTVEQAEKKATTERENFQIQIKERETIARNLEHAKARSLEIDSHISLINEKLNEAYI